LLVAQQPSLSQQFVAGGQELLQQAFKACKCFACPCLSFVRHKSKGSSYLCKHKLCF